MSPRGSMLVLNAENSSAQQLTLPLCCSHTLSHYNTAPPSLSCSAQCTISETVAFTCLLWSCFLQICHNPPGHSGDWGPVYKMCSSDKKNTTRTSVNTQYYLLACCLLTATASLPSLIRSFFWGAGKGGGGWLFCLFVKPSGKDSWNWRGETFHIWYLHSLRMAGKSGRCSVSARVKVAWVHSEWGNNSIRKQWLNNCLVGVKHTYYHTLSKYGPTVWQALFNFYSLFFNNNQETANKNHFLWNPPDVTQDPK